MIQSKICGITEAHALEAAVSGGARFVGFMFYEPSPRYISRDGARELALRVPSGVKVVGVFVNPSDAYLDEVLGALPLDMIQLHGDEAPARVAEIKARTSMPVMKAVPVYCADDVKNAAQYEGVADWFLFDAKAQGGGVSGGLGQVFDWDLLRGYTCSVPWMLSGGLTAENVSEALKVLTPAAVDVSSGVEISRGVKDPVKIRAFLEAVKAV